MPEHWAVALPMLAADVVNPVLLAAAVVAAGSARPWAAAPALILGHTLAYFAVGLALLYGLADLAGHWLAPLTDRFSAPREVDYAVGLVLGLILTGVALRWRVSPPEASGRRSPTAGAGVGGSFALGSAITVIGIPLALPYFAFLSQIDRLAPERTLTALAVYNLAYALPYLGVPLSLAVAGRTVLPVLRRAVAKVERLSRFVPPVLLGIVGMGLLANATLFFATGTGLVQPPQPSTGWASTIQLRYIQAPPRVRESSAPS